MCYNEEHVKNVKNDVTTEMGAAEDRRKEKMSTRDENIQHNFKNGVPLYTFRKTYGQSTDPERAPSKQEQEAIMVIIECIRKNAL